MVKTLVFPIERDGQQVGNVTVYPHRDTATGQRTAEISYHVDEPYRGQGLATEALRHVSQKLLEGEGYDVLFCNCYADNKASVRVMEKAGYTDSGKLIIEEDAPEKPIRVFFMLR